MLHSCSGFLCLLLYGVGSRTCCTVALVFSAFYFMVWGHGHFAQLLWFSLPSTLWCGVTDMLHSCSGFLCLLLYGVGSRTCCTVALVFSAFYFMVWGHGHVAQLLWFSLPSTLWCGVTDMLHSCSGFLCLLLYGVGSRTCCTVALVFSACYFMVWGHGHVAQLLWLSLSVTLWCGVTDMLHSCSGFLCLLLYSVGSRTCCTVAQVFSACYFIVWGHGHGAKLLWFSVQCPFCLLPHVWGLPAIFTPF